MVNEFFIEEKIEKIKKMPLNRLFQYGRKLYIDIKIFEEQDGPEKAPEVESDDNCYHVYFLEAVIGAILKKGYGITDHIANIKWENHYFATFGEYLDLNISQYVLRSMQKNNAFCRKVITHYLLKTPSIRSKIFFHGEIDVDEEVDKWIDYHNSEEFKKRIAEDAFSITRYIMGLAKMVHDYFNSKKGNKNV